MGGILETVLTLPPEATQAVTNRFKVLGQLDIAVRHRPQDGAFRVAVNRRPIDVRMSSIPTVTGEKSVKSATPRSRRSSGRRPTRAISS